MRQELGPAPDEIAPAAQEIPRRPPLRWIDVGEREVASAHQACDLVGILAVVLGLRAVHGLHVERVAEDERDAFPPAKVG